MPITGQGKSKKASGISSGFYFSTLYSSSLKENTKKKKKGMIKFCHLRAASLKDPEDLGRKKGVEEGGAGTGSSEPEGCAGSSEGPLHL